MLRWRSVTIATTPGTRGLDITTRLRIVSVVALRSSILFPPCLLLRLERPGPSMSPPRMDAASLFHWQHILYLCRHSGSADREARVAAGGDRVAFLSVGAHTADIGQQAARLALHVGAHVPRVGLDHEGGGGGL